MSAFSSIVTRLLGKGPQQCAECDVTLQESRVQWVNGFPACATHADRVFLDTVV